MRQWVLLLITLVIVSGCCRFGTCFHRNCHKELFKKPTGEVLEEINYQSMVDIVFGWGAQLRYDKGIRLKSSCAVFNEKYKKIKMHFISQDILELQEARTLLVYIVEGLLSRVNSHVGLNEASFYHMDKDCFLRNTLEGKLENRPFTAKNLEIIIAFESFHGLFVDPKYTGWIWMKDGTVAFADFRVYFSELDPYGCKYEPYSLVKQLVEVEKKVKAPFIEPVPRSTIFKERYIP